MCILSPKLDIEASLLTMSFDFRHITMDFTVNQKFYKN